MWNLILNLVFFNVFYLILLVRYSRNKKEFNNFVKRSFLDVCRIVCVLNSLMDYFGERFLCLYFGFIYRFNEF